MSAPITKEDFDRYVKHMFRERKTPPETDAETVVFLHKHNIPYAMQNGLALISAESARKIRAIREHQ